jgi:hypothetical protein
MHGARSIFALIATHIRRCKIPDCFRYGMMLMTRSKSIRPVVLAAVLLSGLLAATLHAHDSPADVTIQTYVKAEGQILHLLARVPLASIRDVEWPLASDDVLDASRASETLTAAATRALGNEVRVFAGDAALPPAHLASVRATPADDKSFETYERASALFGANAATPSGVHISTGFLDAQFDFPLPSADARISIDPRWGPKLGNKPVTVIRLMLPDGAVRPFDLEGSPGVVQLDPSWTQAALRFVKLGFEHILSGTDHLLFLFALVVPFRKPRHLLVVITAFTVAHSITLIASAYDFAPQSGWFPPIVETLIAASIVYMTLENMVGIDLRRRWLVTFGFGLVHGFGFSFALKQTLQLAGAHLLTSLLSFNVGVELGQLMVLAIIVPVLAIVFAFVPERMGVIFLSALVAHTGWHWLLDRASILRRYRFQWPDSVPQLIVSGPAVFLGLLLASWLLITLLTRARARVRA